MKPHFYFYYFDYKARQAILKVKVDYQDWSVTASKTSFTFSFFVCQLLLLLKGTIEVVLELASADSTKTECFISIDEKTFLGKRRSEYARLYFGSRQNFQNSFCSMENYS